MNCRRPSSRSASAIVCPMARTSSRRSSVRTEATITLDDDVIAIDDMLETREHEILEGGKLKVRLGRYGYLWLRVRREGERKLS